MKVSTRQPGTAKVRREATRSHRHFDIAGILLFALAIVVAVALVSSDSGLIGSTLGSLCRMTFGKGAWAAPVLITILGVGLVKGESPSISHFSVGISLIFLAIIGALASSVSGNFFDPQAIRTSGGYLGAAIGWIFSSLFGSAKPVGISALGLIGIILCVDVPIREMLAKTKSTAITIRDRTRERTQERAQDRPKPVQTPQDRIKPLLKGPIALAWSADPVAVAKTAVEFAKTNEKFVVVGGALGTQSLNADGIKALAELPSLNELRASLVGMISTPATRIAGILQAPAGQLARVFAAYAKRDEGAADAEAA